MNNSTDLITALDYSRFDPLDEYAELGSIYWTRQRGCLKARAADRRGAMSAIAAVTREAFGIAKMLGAASDEARCSA